MLVFEVTHQLWQRTNFNDARHPVFVINIAVLHHLIVVVCLSWERMCAPFTACRHIVSFGSSPL